MSSIKIAFDNPWLLLLTIPALAAVLIPFFLLPKRRRRTFKKIAPVVLHGAVVICLVLMLAGFRVQETSNEQTVLLLVDFSDSTQSVQSELVAHTEELLSVIDGKTEVGVILFGSNQVYAATLDENRRSFKVDTVVADATDMDAALTYAATLLPTDTAGHVILLSDGLETDGDAQNTAAYLATHGIRIDAVYFDSASNQVEMQIGRFAAPEGAYVGDEITFEADIVSNTAGSITLKLFDGDTLVYTTDMTVEAGETGVLLPAVAESAGIHTYRLRLIADTDTMVENNTAYTYLKVAGEPTVLLISDSVLHAGFLKSTLSLENTVTVVTAQNAPKNITELCKYDEVILNNVDYDDLPTGYASLLDIYVGTYGRSLLVVGGRDTMMYGNMEGTHLEEMLPVTLSMTQDEAGQSVALMLVLDCSGSMSMTSTYLSVAKQGAIKCVEAMTDNDWVGVVSFNRSAYLKSPPVQATDANKDAVTRIISGLTTSQGTYYTEALQLAYDELMKSSADIKHIIFLSDGQPSDYGYSSVASKAAANGISVSTIGLGYSSSILSSLAETAGGRYYYVTRATELPDIMLSETEQVTVSSLCTGSFVPVVNQPSVLTDFLGGASLPAITGYLGTTLKEKAAAYLTTDDGNPIYASWTYGLGTVSCFTSDLYGSWSSAWTTDADSKTLIANMISTTVAGVHHDSSLTADIQVRGKTADVTVQTADADTESAVTLSVGSGKNSEQYILSQTAPGVWQVSIPAESAGVYQVMLTETDASNEVTDYLETAFAVSYSAEYNAFATGGQQLLENICRSTGGSLYTDMSALGKAEMSAVESVYQPLVLPAILTLILMLADIAIRKLRLKDIPAYFKSAGTRKAAGVRSGDIRS